MGGYRWLRTRLMPRERVTDGGPVTVDGLIADVTREREILAALAEQGEVVERLTSSIAETVYTLEVLSDGQFVPRFRSDSFTALTGGEPPDAPNEAWTGRIHPDDRPGIAAMDADSWTIEYRLLGADGVERWILDRARRHVTPDGRVFIEGIAADNTERRRAEESLDEAVARLKVMSETDELTGLANRRVMTDALEQALATAEAEGTAVAVVMLDVDRFKQINDTYGHAAGDEVLRELARRFESLVRQTDGRRAPDLVARWGGEEFCALIAGVDDPAVARAAGERIREATVAAPFRLSSGTEIAVTISAGGHRRDGFDRASRGRGRSGALHRQATRSRPGAAVHRPRPGRPRAGRLRRRPSGAGAGVRGRDARGRAGPALAARVRPRRRDRRRTSGCPTRWSSAAAWPAGCTTSGS